MGSPLLLLLLFGLQLADVNGCLVQRLFQVVEVRLSLCQIHCDLTQLLAQLICLHGMHICACSKADVSSAVKSMQPPTEIMRTALPKVNCLLRCSKGQAQHVHSDRTFIGLPFKLGIHACGQYPQTKGWAVGEEPRTLLTWLL